VLKVDNLDRGLLRSITLQRRAKKDVIKGTSWATTGSLSPAGPLGALKGARNGLIQVQAPDLLDGVVRGGRLLLLHLLPVHMRLLRVRGVVHGLIHGKATILCSLHQSDW
jgi:hypothetical protein